MVYADIVLVASGKGSGYYLQDSNCMTAPVDGNFYPVKNGSLKGAENPSTYNRDYDNSLRTYPYYSGALVVVADKNIAAQGGGRVKLSNGLSIGV